VRKVPIETRSHGTAARIIKGRTAQDGSDVG